MDEPVIPPAEPEALQPSQEPVPISGTSIASSTLEPEQPPKDITKRQVKAEWLKPYHFKPGQSGNPSGRRKEHPLTDSAKMILKLPYPPALRIQFEERLGMKLRKDITFSDAIMLGRAIGAVTNTDTAEWMAALIEGPLTQKFDVNNTGGPLAPPVIIMQSVRIVKDDATEEIKVFDVQPRKPDGNNGSGTGNPSS